jgi:hypothetical protein
MEKTVFKFNTGERVRIIQSGIIGKVIDHRNDRDDNVDTLVQYTNARKGVTEQWVRETELGSTTASDLEIAHEKTEGVASDPMKVVGTDPKIANETRAEHERAAERGRDVRGDVRKAG